MGSLPLAQGGRRLGGQRHDPDARRRARRRGARVAPVQRLPWRHGRSRPPRRRTRCPARSRWRGQIGGVPGHELAVAAQQAFVDGMHTAVLCRRGDRRARRRCSRRSRCRPGRRPSPLASRSRSRRERAGAGRGRAAPAGAAAVCPLAPRDRGGDARAARRGRVRAAHDGAGPAPRGRREGHDLPPLAVEGGAGQGGDPALQRRAAHPRHRLAGRGLRPRRPCGARGRGRSRRGAAHAAPARRGRARRASCTRSSARSWWSRAAGSCGSCWSGRGSAASCARTSTSSSRIDMLVGPIIYRFLITGGDLVPAAAQAPRVLAALLDGLRPPAPGR